MLNDAVAEVQVRKTTTDTITIQLLVLY